MITILVIIYAVISIIIAVVSFRYNETQYMFSYGYDKPSVVKSMIFGATIIPIISVILLAGVFVIGFVAWLGVWIAENMP